jgi:hypothetical protein
MDHYLGYHNAEEGRPFAHNGKFFTAKSFLPETLLHDRIWVIEGRGTPRQYKIVSTGFITNVAIEKRPDQYRTSEREDGLTIYFIADAFDDPLDVTSLEWFRKLRNSLQNFSRGFTRLTDPLLVTELEAAWISRGTPQSNDLSADLRAIDADTTIQSTIKKRLIDARLGQGKFRQSLETRWQNVCAVTGCTISPVLRASHIKPWKDSRNDERLDPDNGLLLAAHVDAVFDTGLISFRDDGRMLISKSITSRDRRTLQLGGSLSKKLNAGEKKFLRFHRDSVFLDNQLLR